LQITDSTVRLSQVRSTSFSSERERAQRKRERAVFTLPTSYRPTFGSTHTSQSYLFEVEFRLARLSRQLFAWYRLQGSDEWHSAGVAC